MFASTPSPPTPTRNINLADALDRFVAELVQSGSYQNASEVVRAALRLLKVEEETRARKLAALNAAIQERSTSGPASRASTRSSMRSTPK